MGWRPVSRALTTALLVGQAVFIGPVESFVANSSFAV